MVAMFNSASRAPGSSEYARHDVSRRSIPMVWVISYRHSLRLNEAEVKFVGDEWRSRI